MAVSISRRAFLDMAAALAATPLLEALPQSGGGQSEATFSTDVNVVNLFVTVHDKQGKIITDLAKEDFALSEDGRAQTIKYFSRETNLPLTLGLLVGTIGLDNLTAVPRFTFGNPSLSGGISFAALAIGLFGLSEILINLEKTESIKAIQPKLRDLVPRWKDLRDSSPAVGRASLI